MYTHERLMSIETEHVDMVGRMRPSALFACMQSAATDHADALGLGHLLMLEKHAAWVLSRVHVKMRRLPRLQEQLRIRTYTGPIRKLFYPRWFIFENAQGEVLGEAASVWFVIDIDTHVPLSPKATGILIDDSDPPVLPLALPNRWVFPGTWSHVSERTVCFSDIDVNHHMNNIRYLDWSCDVLPYEQLLKKDVCEIQIAYRSEALIGQNMNLCWDKEDDTFFVKGSTSEKTVFECALIMAD